MEKGNEERISLTSALKIAETRAYFMEVFFFVVEFLLLILCYVTYEIFF